MREKVRPQERHGEGCTGLERIEKKNHGNSWLTHIHVENGYVLVSTVVRFHLIIQQRLLDALNSVRLF